MQASYRDEDPTGARIVEQLRAQVPHEIAALRAKLPQLRAEHPGSHDVLGACDLVSVALDRLTTVLVQEWTGAANARRNGHR